MTADIIMYLVEAAEREIDVWREIAKTTRLDASDIPGRMDGKWMSVEAGIMSAVMDELERLQKEVIMIRNDRHLFHVCLIMGPVIERMFREFQEEVRNSNEYA
jgi:hypothetical protein